MPKRSELKSETRVEAVLALLRKEEPASVLARRYQVSEQTLYRWRDIFLEAGKSGLVKGEAKPDESSRRFEQMERELSKRAQVIGELSLANDLLKKLRMVSH
jgi:transposase-like protein